jgi:hypothetical protein
MTQDLTADEMKELPPKVQTLLHSMKTEVTNLETQINDQLNAPPRSIPIIKPPKLQNPTSYDGTRNTRLIDDYLYDVRQHILNDPLNFVREDTKIRFAASFLKGLARTWFRTLDDDDSLRPWTTFEDFKDALKKEFSELDALEYWRKRWENLQQRSSITAYLADFKTIVLHLDVTEEDKYHTFKKGLRSNVLDQMALQPRPETFEELVTLANQVDQRIFEHQHGKGPSNNKTKVQTFNTFQRKTVNPGFNRGASSTVATSTTGSTYAPWRPSPKASYPNNQPVGQSRWFTPADDCMQLDVIQKGPISDKQRDYRRRNNLCLYCGMAGHLAKDCPLKINRPNPDNKPKN